MRQFLGGAPLAPQSFDETYRCYSVAMAGRSELEQGDKILMPSSALETLSEWSAAAAQIGVR